MFHGGTNKLYCDTASPLRERPIICFASVGHHPAYKKNMNLFFFSQAQKVEKTRLTMGGRRNAFIRQVRFGFEALKVRGNSI